MDKGLREKTEPFDSFIQIFKVLTVAGFAKLFKPRNHCAEIMHKVYRLIVVFIVFTYNLQHCVYVWQMRDHAGKFIEGVILEIPEFVLCLKVLVMYFESRRFDKLVELIKDPIFEAKNKEDEKYIKENNKAMQKLSKFTLVGLSSVGVFWIITPILKRMSDETVNVPSYMPFKTDTWPRFLLAIFFDTSPVLWIGYGHFHIDCLIASFYSQARSQIKIMKYNLEHLFDDAKTTDQRPANFKFLDLMDETIQGRFVHYVRRYESVVWFTNEVTDIFGKAISFQFLMTSFSTCLVVYQMSSMSTFSVEFVFFMGYYLATQFQIFIYCYYGGLVEYESKFIIDSLYLGEWLSLSPKFRKQVVIAMSRWIRPITPRVSGIVPLSLTTFLTITRSAYTLYTVLKTSNNKNSGERTLAF